MSEENEPQTDPQDPGPKFSSYKEDPEFLPWLKQQDGFKDLFTDPEPLPKGNRTKGTAAGAANSIPTTSGGGQTVAPQKAESTMSDIVGAVTEAAVRAASAGGGARPGQAPAPPSPNPPPISKRVNWFWGELIGE